MVDTDAHLPLLKVGVVNDLLHRLHRGCRNPVGQKFCRDVVFRLCPRPRLDEVVDLLHVVDTVDVRLESGFVCKV
jgi:hypothetical protein